MSAKEFQDRRQLFGRPTLPLADVFGWLRESLQSPVVVPLVVIDSAQFH